MAGVALAIPLFKPWAVQYHLLLNLHTYSCSKSILHRDPQPEQASKRCQMYIVLHLHVLYNIINVNTIDPALLVHTHL